MTDHQARQPDPFDVEVGARVRERRKALGISQADLAAAVNLTFQQIQKYERGTNRISCSTLRLIAGRLTIPMSSLLAEDVSEEDRHAFADALRLSHQALQLARVFERIQDPAQRRALAELAATMAEPAVISDPSA